MRVPSHQPTQKWCPVELPRSGTRKSSQWDKEGTAAIFGKKRREDEDTEEEEEEEDEEVGGGVRSHWLKPLPGAFAFLGVGARGGRVTI